MTLAETWAGWVAACVGTLILAVTAILGGTHGHDSDGNMGSGALGGDPGAWAGAGANVSFLGMAGGSDGWRGFVRGLDGVGDIPASDEPEIPAIEAAEVDAVAEGDPGGSPLTDLERLICSYAWDCATATRVARCESGPDYTAGYNGSGHAGTWQLSPIHAWRFTRRGWSFWNDALDLYRGTEIAYEIYTEQGFRPWSCF